MLLLQPKSNDPSYNIAFEEFVFEHLAQNEDCFILWINRPCIVVGKNQNTLEEINQDYCQEKGIQIVRRRSGGGAVYHDLGNLNYTITSRKGRSDAFDFQAFSQPVLACLAEMGVEATFTGRNDLQIQGEKFCGNAQLIKGNKLLHHGCMLFDTDLSVLAQALKVKPLKLESKGKKSVRARVTNIKPHLPDASLTVEDFRDKLHQYMIEHFNAKVYTLSEEEEKKVQAYKVLRNDSWEWVYGNNPEFTFQNTRYTSAGLIEIKAMIDNFVIQDIHFYGDFFGVKEVSELEEALVNTPYTREAVAAKLESFQLNEYFLGINKEELLALIFIEDDLSSGSSSSCASSENTAMEK